MGAFTYQKALFHVSIQLRDDVHALVDAEDAAVQRQVVVLGVAPLHVCFSFSFSFHNIRGGVRKLTICLSDEENRNDEGQQVCRRERPQKAVQP